MPDVRDARKKVKIAIAALLAVDIISGLVLLSPLVGSERSRREQLDQLWRELQQKTRAAEPLRDFDKKIATARRQIDDFYKNRTRADGLTDECKTCNKTISGADCNQKEMNDFVAKHKSHDLSTSTVPGRGVLFPTRDRLRAAKSW